MNNIQFDTFNEAAKEFGLLSSDDEYDKCMSEAANNITDISKLRELFVSILINCQPSDPNKLWNNHKDNLTSDILYRIRKSKKNNDLPINNIMHNLSLYYMDLMLLKFGKKMSDYTSMPIISKVDEDLIFASESSNLNDEHFDINILNQYLSENLPKMNCEQKIIYNKIINKIDSKNISSNYSK